MKKAVEVEAFVVGLGAMGSSTLYALSRRGVQAVGADRFCPPHSFGSSHGKSRVIRQAYFEDPRYVPLVLRSYELWRELETASGVPLLTLTGGLMAGDGDGPIVQGTIQSARTHGLLHEVLSPETVASRFPAFRLRRGEVGVYEEMSGVLRPEDAIGAFLRGAETLGATVLTDTPVLGIQPQGSKIRIETDSADFLAERVLMSTGAWMSDWLKSFPFQVERQVMHWFEAPSEAFAPPLMPLFLISRSGQEPVIYGMPDLGEGFKAAFHHGGDATSADLLDRSVRADDRERLVTTLTDIFPALSGSRPRESLVCMYTNTPDEHFVIGPHPSMEGVFVAGGFSGHGFKFASAVGEGVAALMGGHTPPVGLSLFDPARFT